MRVQGGDFSSEKTSGETCTDLSNQRSGNYLCTGNGFSVSSTSISKSGTTYGVDHPPLPRKLQEFPTCPAGDGVASIWSAAEDSRYGNGSRRHVEAGRPAVSAPRAYRVRDRKERFIVYKVRYSWISPTEQSSRKSQLRGSLPEFHGWRWLIVFKRVRCEESVAEAKRPPCGLQ